MIKFKQRGLTIKNNKRNSEKKKQTNNEKTNAKTKLFPRNRKRAKNQLKYLSVDRNGNIFVKMIDTKNSFEIVKKKQ